MDSGKSPSKIIPQYEHLVALNPNQVGYLRRLAMLMLDRNEPQGEINAARLFVEIWEFMWPVLKRNGLLCFLTQSSALVT